MREILKENILEGFKLADIQTYLNIRKQLKSYNKNDDYVRSYIDTVRTLKSSRHTPKSVYKKCPNCDTNMDLESINVDPKGRDRIGDPKHKSWWICPVDLEVIYNKETVKEIVSKLKGKKNHGECNTRS